MFVGDRMNERAGEVATFFEQVQCTANHWSEFLLDYAIEGDKWYQENPSYRMDTSRFDRNRSAR